MGLTEKLREQLRSMGLSQVEIAERSGLTQPQVSKFLGGAGANSRTIDRLAAFCRAEIRFQRRARWQSAK